MNREFIVDVIEEFRVYFFLFIEFASFYYRNDALGISEDGGKRSEGRRREILVVVLRKDLLWVRKLVDIHTDLAERIFVEVVIGILLEEYFLESTFLLEVRCIDFLREFSCECEKSA